MASLVIKLRNDKKRVTHIYTCRSFKIVLDKYTLLDAVSLTSGAYYKCISFYRNDWRTI